MIYAKPVSVSFQEKHCIVKNFERHHDEIANLATSDFT